MSKGWYAVLPWSDTDREFFLEREIDFRGDKYNFEVSRIHENMDTMDDEGWYQTTGYTYEFVLYEYSELNLSYDVPVTDLTDDENIWLQKEIDECAADEAAAAAERRNDR